MFVRMMRGFSNLIIHEGEKETMRLSKWLSTKSVCSRRQAEQLIKLGLIRVDGKRIRQNMLININADLKAFTPKGIQKEKPITKLWMINKPRGCICTTNDPQKRPTIYSLLPPQFQKYGHIMSIGRLDFNSQGLLLLTNDSAVKNLLQNPQANLIRYYQVKVHGRVTPEKMDKMVKPMLIRGVQYGPLHVTLNRPLETNSWLNISLKTGRNNQIRKIMQKCDLQVNKLIRVEYGPYKLGKMQHRQLRQLPLTEGFQRKLKLTKAKQLLGSSNGSLIEVDMRRTAILYAREQLQALEFQQKNKQTKVIDSQNVKGVLPNNSLLLQNDQQDNCQ